LGIFSNFNSLIKAKVKVIDFSEYSKYLLNLFSTSEKILIISHINPDGDAIGSQLALYHFLKSIGKDPAMIAPNYLQEFLKWMDGSDQINIFLKERRKCSRLIGEADLIMMVDFNHSSRLGETKELVLASSAKKVIIDHHLNPESFADLIICEPSMCSTSELVHELVCQMNVVPFVNKSYAEALYVGIITDTGNFEHGSYSSRTFRIVADLLEFEIEKEKVLDMIYNNFSSDRMRLQGFALNERMVILPDYGTAYISLTKKDLEDYKHVKGDTEGFVNLPLSIKGIRFSTLFIEKDNFIKLSFRSNGKFPSNKFAEQYFAGGGHLNASGGEYYDTLDNTVKYFLIVLKDFVSWFENSES